MKAYIDGFANEQDVLEQFNAPEEYKKAKILFAWYNYEDYSGSAFVLFKHGRKLYEANGSHCSCNGLEECWSPEETSVEALLHRLDNGTGYWYGMPEKELRKVLKSLSKRKQTTKLNP
jgi:hypothetical protein